MDTAAHADRLADAAIRAAADRRPPGATYRLQMHAGFTFRDAQQILPYLEALGITHLYLSPVLAARPGSTHGYDVIDPTTLNPEIGSEADFRALAEAARARGMGLLLDVVPNHMLLGAANPWWRDVLEHGPSSPYAGYFDIAWDDPPRADLQNRVMLPVLGSPYYQVLESGDLQLDLDGGALVVRLYGSLLPVDPRTYDRVLKPALDLLTEAPAEAVSELQSILTAVRHLPPRTETDPERLAEGRAESEVIKRRLTTLTENHPPVRDAIRAVIDTFRCTPDCPEACSRLDALLDAQAYRLCFWRVASDEINYRRFFDVNELSALSAEREDVFQATHDLVLRLYGAGWIDGLRIDHPDGLYDPKQYLDRLQESAFLAVARHRVETDPEFQSVSWTEVEPLLRERYTARSLIGPDVDTSRRSEPALYVVVEKILERSERLPSDWPTAGTTGYEFLNAVNGLFVDSSSTDLLTRAYTAFSGRDDPFPEVVFRTKMLVLQSAFASELDMLARQFDRLARKNRRARDFTLNGLRRALRAVIASFPVYRSYIDGHVSRTDEGLVRLAVFRARRRSPTVSQELFDFIRDTLLLRPAPPGVPEDYFADQRRIAGKFQQVTAPVTAKGLEDTSFYRYVRLVSLNEVGGDPGKVGWSPEEVHRFFVERQTRHPLALSAGSTHDTKRGEDVRTRIDVLAELPEEWANRARRWFELNRPHRIELEELSAPDPNDEYLLYQTLVGAWPTGAETPEGLEEFAERLRRYMNKAVHEAKEHTSWINPNPEYDAAIQEFVTRILDPARSAEFLADLKTFVARVARVGMVNSLAQTLLRCLAPGVPDTYQGTELWDLNLVDPDNRRPVDYALRENLLRELDQKANGEDARAFVQGLLERPTDGRVKLYILAQALRLRRKAPELFRNGDYRPITPTGAMADHVFAFARRLGEQTILVVAPRLMARHLGEGNRLTLEPEVWGDTRLPLEGIGEGSGWVNRLTGEHVVADQPALSVAQVLGQFPVAVLERQP